jgi:hypothetical protein
MAKKKPATVARPYTTDYGDTKGHCTTKENALCAAFVKVVKHKLKFVTIEGPSGRAIGRLRRSGDGFFGILIEPAAGSKPKLIPGTASPHLKRVK